MIGLYQVMTVNFKLLAGNLATIAAGSENDLWPLHQNGTYNIPRLNITPSLCGHANGLQACILKASAYMSTVLLLVVS
jgi:hypothetical protein